jgi:ABC-type branched-subunit amino acid transport system substrate-binding protein
MNKPHVSRVLTAAVAIIVAATPIVAGGASSRAASSQTGGAPIYVAVVGAMTGTYSEIGTAMLEGARAGAQEINDAGGILGRKLVLDVVDTVGDPADAVPAFNKEIATANPAGVIGPAALEIFALKPLIDRDQIPDMFNGGSTLFDTNTDKWIWRINPSDSQLGVAMALYAHKQGYKRAALLFSTEQSGQTLKPVLANTFKKLGGQIVADVNVTPNQTSYRSEVLKVVNAHPQIIFTQMEPSTAAVALSDFREINNLAIPFIGTDLTAGGDWIKAVTPAIAHRIMTSVEGSSVPGGGGTWFLRYNQQVNHHAPLAGANYAYDGIIDLALAIDAAGSTDAGKIIAQFDNVSNPPGLAVTNYRDALAALKAHKKINYEGTSGPMDFDKFHNVSGPWDVVKSDTQGNLKTLLTLSATDVGRAAS